MNLKSKLNQSHDEQLTYTLHVDIQRTTELQQQFQQVKNTHTSSKRENKTIRITYKDRREPEEA